MMGGNDMDDPVLIEQSAEALKKYLGVSVDTSQYEISVTFFEAVDEEDEASYFVFFEAPANRPLLLPEENIGPDGFPAAGNLQTINTRVQHILLGKQGNYIPAVDV